MRGVRQLGIGLALGALFGVAKAQTAALTAAQVIERVEAATKAKLPASTVDTFKAGDPGTVVTGIVTTFTPSMEVLRRAVAENKNLIITHEPTFYNHRDEATLFENDAVYKEKFAYINAHTLVVWRFHDGWHARRPDGIEEGFVEAVGWGPYMISNEQMLFTLPAMTVADLARSLQAKLGTRSIRVIGDPSMRVTHVAYRPGASGEERQVRALELPEVEVLVAGESSEWETVEYTRDAMQQGRKKALILVGHNASEEVGMKACAAWLRGLFPGLPVEYVPAGEPYWTTDRLPK